MPLNSEREDAPEKPFLRLGGKMQRHRRTRAGKLIEEVWTCIDLLDGGHGRVLYVLGGPNGQRRALLRSTLKRCQRWSRI